MPKSASASRQRLLAAAAKLIAEARGGDFSLRDVCKAAGVEMPTLYHFFGSKEGLISEVVQYGFDLYRETEKTVNPSTDPIDDLRAHWNVYVDFGMTNPAFYKLMVTRVGPGDKPATQLGYNFAPRVIADAERLGLLAVPATDAVSLVTATLAGVTLRQVLLDTVDRQLTDLACEATILAITAPRRHSLMESLTDSARHAQANPEILGSTETRLLAEWLQRLKGRPTDRD